MIASDGPIVRAPLVIGVIKPSVHSERKASAAGAGVPAGDGVPGGIGGTGGISGGAQGKTGGRAGGRAGIGGRPGTGGKPGGWATGGKGKAGGITAGTYQATTTSGVAAKINSVRSTPPRPLLVNVDAIKI